jgi:hypothetical protein
VNCESHFEHPANDWRGPITVSWFQGGAMPRTPKSSIDLAKIGHGAMFKGTKGFIISDFDSRIILPFGDDADMSYYKPRKKEDNLPMSEKVTSKNNGSTPVVTRASQPLATSVTAPT